MKKIGFIGAYDKSYMILSIAKVLETFEKKVLIIDATLTQKTKYTVPVINPTRTYITEFEGVDVAVGFDSMENIKQYIGLSEDEDIEYDYIMIDADDYEIFTEYEFQGAEKVYFVTSFESFYLKRGIEILKQIRVPLQITKVFYTKEMLKEEEDYFDYLALELKNKWDENKIYFLLENGDLPAIIENERINKIKLRNLSEEYRENIIFMANEIAPEIDEKEIRLNVKNL